MNSTACSQCGEKILPHWTLCPVCALPFADAVTTTHASTSGVEAADEHTSVLDICCVQCKAILTPDAQICPRCHVLIIRRYCSGCSRLIPEQAAMCPYCATPASAKKSRLKSYLQTAIILIVVASAVGGLLLIVYTVPTTEPPRPVARPIVRQRSFIEEPPAIRNKEVEVIPETKESIEEENILEPIPQEKAIVTPVSDEEPPELDWKARGAKLKQGRKLTEHASLLMQRGRYGDASIILNEAIHTFPDKTKDLSYGEALYKLGICLRKKGQPEQAIPFLQEAMRFPYIRSKVLREVEAATSQLQRSKVNQTRGGTSQ